MHIQLEWQIKILHCTEQFRFSFKIYFHEILGFRWQINIQVTRSTQIICMLFSAVLKLFIAVTIVIQQSTCMRWTFFFFSLSLIFHWIARARSSHSFGQTRYFSSFRRRIIGLISVSLFERYFWIAIDPIRQNSSEIFCGDKTFRKYLKCSLFLN